VIQSILIITPVWPEPASSAAGTHMLQIIAALHAQGWCVHVASTAERSEFQATLEPMVAMQHHIAVNDSGFDTFVAALQPDVVIFEHFSMEEQFGWRVEKHCPDAMRVLQTVDLHAMREARRKAFLARRTVTDEDIFDVTAQGEIAAIYRCDLSLLISTVEMHWLSTRYAVPPELLHYCPFMFEARREAQAVAAYQQRQHFVTIGNFRHPPNWDSVQWLHESIWPQIRQQIPDAQLHVYGSYMPPKAKALHRPQHGFYVNGRADDAQQVMQQARVCLAPLRFGAGLKGKLADAMLSGTPSVTTDIGAEGMHGDLPWGGAIVPCSAAYSDADAEAFAQAAVALYDDAARWQLAQQQGFDIVRRCFDASEHAQVLTRRIDDVYAQLSSHRMRNFTGAMLRHHHHRSTEFMSRWIEEKNRNSR